MKSTPLTVIRCILATSLAIEASLAFPFSHIQRHGRAEASTLERTSAHFSLNQEALSLSDLFERHPILAPSVLHNILKRASAILTRQKDPWQPISLEGSIVGSHRTGTSSKDSDIDLMVWFRNYEMTNSWAMDSGDPREWQPILVDEVRTAIEDAMAEVRSTMNPCTRSRGFHILMGGYSLQMAVDWLCEGTLILLDARGPKGFVGATYWTREQREYQKVLHEYQAGQLDATTWVSRSAVLRAWILSNPQTAKAVITSRLLDRGT